MTVWEVSVIDPDSPPTPAQRRAAEDLVERSFASAERNQWFEYQKGLDDGYAYDGNDYVHYRNAEFILDDAILDPDRPEILMYYPTPERHRLAGFMFLTKRRFDRGPQIGGPLTIWHYHIWKGLQCVVGEVTPTRMVDLDVGCPKSVGYHRSFEMMHVWLLDHPGGDFATAMAFPKEALDAALEKRMLERGY